jgi:hypothetical protein
MPAGILFYSEQDRVIYIFAVDEIIHEEQKYPAGAARTWKCYACIFILSRVFREMKWRL